jgi:hypothetical protein
MRRTVIPVLWLWAACAIIGAALAASAKADPADDFARAHAADVCITLDDYPSVAGLIGVMQGVADSGLSDHDAALAVTESITYVCPIHRHLLREFAAYYRHDPQVLT